MSEFSSYAEDGFAAPFFVMTERAAGALYKRVAAVRNDHPDIAEKALGHNCHLLFPWLYDLTMNDGILDAVETVLGPDVLIWSSSFFYKEPDAAGFVSWHQDSTYWGLEPPDEIITAWLALTPSTPASGCLRVVPGSHKQGQIAHKDTFADTNMLSRGQEIAVDVDEADAKDVILRPGQMSLHHVQIVHGSNPNHSTLPRVGFAIRYIPTYVRQLGGRTHATLARGYDKYNHFDHPPRPDADLSPAAWAAHEVAARQANSVLMQGAAQDSKSTAHRVEE